MSKKRIDEELVSSDCLAHFLKNKGGCNKVSVKRNEDDPPDFWFTIDDIKYSIEVTSIVTGQDYHANIKRLTQIIKKSSLENDILSGKYALYIFRKPNIPRKNTTTWRDLVNLSLSFIQATKNLSSTDPLKLFKDSKGYVQIEKIEKHGSSLGYLFTPPLQWERDTQAELTQLMQMQYMKNEKNY